MIHGEFLSTHPVFTGEDLFEYLSSLRKVGARAKESMLAYYRKTGRIIAVKRGLYAVVPPGSDPGSYPVDPFLVGSKLTRDSILSHQSALALHGHAYSVQKLITYSSSRPLPSLTFRDHIFRGAKFTKALQQTDDENYGVMTMDRRGTEIQVTSIERTLVDVLHRPSLCGSWEEIWRSLESVEFFALDELVNYTLKLGNATTSAKVGFFLEQHCETLMVEVHHLKQLHGQRPRQPHYLDRSRRKSGRLVSKWNLVVPRDLLERAWADVL